MNRVHKFKQTEIGLIPEDWEVKELENLFKISAGGDLKNLDFSKTKTDIHIYPIFSNSLNNKGLYGFSKTYQYEPECVTITGRGDVGTAECRKERFCAIVRLLILKPKNEISCYFVASYINNRLDFSHVGSAVNQLTAPMISEFKIALPKIKEQSAIAKILSDLDSKIELLQKQNEILEKIGQAIFKQWFVDFEFPNEEGNPYKSSGGEMIESELGEIPKGWSVGFLDDGISTKLIKTGIDTFEGEKIYLDTASVQNSDIVDLSTKITINEKPSRANMQPISKSIWFAKMKDSKKVLLIDSRDDWLIKNIILSTGFSGLITFNDSLYYIWTIINSDKFEIEKNSLCLGTTMQAINNENIRKIKYVIPSNRLIKLFNIATSKNYEKISSNKSEILNLQKTRDLLLPKLMTGKIRVPLEAEE